MCGIVGALSFIGSNIQISEEYINKMRDTMIHRGPDGFGTWISKDKKIGLGHRRLSIIDLSINALQPMSNEDKTIQIVFNGEIYNYLDIKNELLKTNRHKWKTDHSDTEVIVHAFEEWGIDCIKKFRGMFAIAIWDHKKKELWLIRDYVGIKPLYYSILNNKIIFASEIKALLIDSDQKRILNENALFHYLSFITTPAPETMYEGIKKLPCGTWLKIDLKGNVFIHKYWDVLENTIDLSGYSDIEISEMILNELRTSVKLQKVSDVPIGVFLSGGIDSSTNLALFSENSTNSVNSFTIGYKGNNESYKNETHFARLIAEKVKAKYHEKLLSVDDLINFLPKMVYLQDEPISDPVCIPVYYVSKLARDNNVTVCQVGEGADELFWGYPYWKRMLFLENLNDFSIPILFKRSLLLGFKIIGKKNKSYYEWLRRSVNKEKIFWSGAEAFTQEEKNSFLSKRLKDKFKNIDSWYILKPIYEQFVQKARDKSNLNWMSYLDLNLRLPELLLMRVDKMSMGVSLETRVPFLDHKFVELAMSIPESVKTRNKELKYILKMAVKGIIPSQLIYRKKQGFGLPLYEWFFDKLGIIIQNEIINFCNISDLFDLNGIKNIISNGKKQQIWYIYNFILWYNKFILDKIK